MPDTPRRLPLSVVIIARDSAQLIEPCLESADFAAEVVVLDSGSSDGTQEIARRHGARVIEQAWRGFGPTKQLAVEAAAHDWVLCLDTDERISPQLARSIGGVLDAPRQTAYRMARRNRFMGRWLAHGEGYPDWCLRLFHRAHGRWSDDPVHERVLHEGAVGTLAGDLLHESAEDLAAYIEKQNRYSTLQAERLHRAGRSAGIAQLALSPLVRFVKFYVFRLGFLDGLPGLIHIAIGCFASFAKWAKLRALQAQGEKTE